MNKWHAKIRKSKILFSYLVTKKILFWDTELTWNQRKWFATNSFGNRFVLFFFFAFFNNSLQKRCLVIVSFFLFCKLFNFWAQNLKQKKRRFYFVSKKIKTPGGVRLGLMRFGFQTLLETKNQLNYQKIFLKIQI